MKTSRFRLFVVAIIGLALAFTFSCSDDKSEGGGYLTCSKALKVGKECDERYMSQYDACNDETCFESVTAKMYNECFFPDACGSSSYGACKKHYKDECDFDFGDDGEDNSGGWLSCSAADELYSRCEDKYKSEMLKCGNNPSCTEGVEDKIGKCWDDGACNGAGENVCYAHYDDECGE